MSHTFVSSCLNPTGLVALAVLTATLSKEQHLMTVEIVLDLFCLCRTLRALSYRFQNGYVFDTAQLQTLQHNLQLVREVLEGRTQDQNEHVLDLIAGACTAVNRVMAETRYIVAPPSFFLIYPGDLIVQRNTSSDRYDMQKDCMLESTTQLNERVSRETALWNSLVLARKAVYEHVGRLDGGEEMYDPTFLSRCPDAAAEFFTPGRTFAMLWDSQRDFQIDASVTHYDWVIEAERRIMTGVEGVYTGPYRGPFTARWFIVIHGCKTSCFCLSIVTLPAHLGEINNKRYISIACTSSNRPQSVLQIHSLPVRFKIMKDKRQQSEVPPPSSLPTTNLPRACSDQAAADVLAEIHGRRPKFSKPIPLEVCQRVYHLMERKYYVDTKRMVEVEYGVKVRNVGVVQQSKALEDLISIAGSI